MAKRLFHLLLKIVYPSLVSLWPNFKTRRGGGGAESFLLASPSVHNAHLIKISYEL